MECRIDLNDAEWQLILELLKGKREDLRSEIHHTDNRQFRQALNERLSMIDGLVARLHAQPVTV